MAAPRRIGSTTSETRAQIVEATEQLMIEQGYAAVTSRGVAAAVGINPGLVHYYFPTLDDLFVAVFRRGAEKNVERMAVALASPQPLLALWRLCSEPIGGVLFAELMAAANHRDALREDVTKLADQARRMQIEAMRALLPQYELDEDLYPPALVAAAIQGIALLVSRERALQLKTEHRKTAAAVENLLEHLEQRRKL
jgi:AcrR family transcriptional regulator